MVITRLRRKSIRTSHHDHQGRTGCVRSTTTNGSSAAARQTNQARIVACDQYLIARVGRYKWRRTRYRKAAGRLRERSLANNDTLIDVAAGWTEFDYCLRQELDWRGRYIPVDGGIDGTDLDLWVPARHAEWFVALEILEHFTDPARLLWAMQAHADKGLIISTPNPAVVT
jgi:hypothetical protein